MTITLTAGQIRAVAQRLIAHHDEPYSLTAEQWEAATEHWLRRILTTITTSPEDYAWREARLREVFDHLTAGSQPRCDFVYRCLLPAEPGDVLCAKHRALTVEYPGVYPWYGPLPETETLTIPTADELYPSEG